uniref:Uncharacterized shell protein 11 n=1 Tax=Margaritifera margaritifera TaxID=102329 RepID=USP11_PINMG|nr:RecName: Full=Uncharacterized shell protein 11; AltName: Full=Nacre uncharacterized shell protein 18; Flags: Precursor [Pinctada margaritifera]CCE46183.1 nacre uncharacterized shell protein 18 [Pinctada margaritifera]
MSCGTYKRGSLTFLLVVALAVPVFCQSRTRLKWKTRISTTPEVMVEERALVRNETNNRYVKIYSTRHPKKTAISNATSTIDFEKRKVAIKVRTYVNSQRTEACYLMDPINTHDMTMTVNVIKSRNQTQVIDKTAVMDMVVNSNKLTIDDLKKDYELSRIYKECDKAVVESGLYTIIKGTPSASATSTDPPIDVLGLIPQSGIHSQHIRIHFNTNPQTAPV